MVSLNIDNDLDDLPHTHNLRIPYMVTLNTLICSNGYKGLLGHDRKITKNLNKMDTSMRQTILMSKVTFKQSDPILTVIWKCHVLNNKDLYWNPGPNWQGLISLVL